MNVTKNSFPFGLVLALVLPVLTFLIFYLYKMEQNTSLVEFYDMYASKSVDTHVISLCVLPNLLLFYAFISKNSYNSAKGVISATLIYALIVVIMKYS